MEHTRRPSITTSRSSKGSPPPVVPWLLVMFGIAVVFFTGALLGYAIGGC